MLTNYTHCNFQVDHSPPIRGTVWDGTWLHDQEITADNMTLSASLRGFSDEESFIDHYIWCVGTEPGSDNILACHDVRLQLRLEETTSISIDNGRLN